MRLFVRDLISEDVDHFINQNSDRFAETNYRDDAETVDVCIQVKSVNVSDSCIVILYPNNNWATISIPSEHYFKIEVM